VVENTDPRDLTTARWLFPLYMLAMSLFVAPMAAAGIILFGDGVLQPDRVVLALPMHGGLPWLTLVAYIGGMSAATSMVIMATVTLSTMLCNEVIVPLALRLPRIGCGRSQDLSQALLHTRRVLIVTILILAWLCYRLFTSGSMLTDIGLLSLAGVALFAPPLIGGIFTRHITRSGAISGLLAGLCLWLYTLVFPALAAQGWLPEGWVADGPLGIGWLAPHGLFNTHLGGPLTHGVVWTLGGEIAVMAAVSLNTSATLIERSQAAAFVGLGVQRITHRSADMQPADIQVGELEVLLQRFLGPQAARAALSEYAGNKEGRELLSNQLVDAQLLQFAEQRLAGVVGSASARLMLASGLRQHDLAVEDMIRLLDRTADAVEFNRSVMQAALENIDQGISVIDQDLRLVAWNTRYTELFEYPPGMVRSGRHIAELIRFNALRGECGLGPVEEHVGKRLGHLRAGTPHRFERHRHNGTVVLMTGNPIPGGGFVTTFNDITEFKRNESELTRVNQELEARVARRTSELSRANEELRRENQQRAQAEAAAVDARCEAERANLSKTRFLAAASHDLLQPLNAARLFASGAERGEVDAQTAALENIQASLEAAQALLEPLLDISKIDAGAWDAKPEDFPLSRILTPLAEEFEVLAGHAGLSLHAVNSSAWVRSDPNLLRRILQNFLANAVRYTQHGRILFGVRRPPGQVSIEIWDTGPGIAADQLSSIFDEFHRGASSQGISERGLGLGLSLADRMARLLGHEISVDSQPGRGTVFRIRVDLALAVPAAVPATTAPTGTTSIDSALCVDDDGASVEALMSLLERWGIDCMTAPAEDAEALLSDLSFDIALIDFDLGEQSRNGLELIAGFRARFPGMRFILVTANRDQEIAARAESLDINLVYKPIGPAKLAQAIYWPTRGEARKVV
jgi:signal transduction histidine kinase